MPCCPVPLLYSLFILCYCALFEQINKDNDINSCHRTSILSVTSDTGDGAKSGRLDDRSTLWGPETEHGRQQSSVGSRDKELLARDEFVRTDRRAIAIMFVCLSVCLGGGAL